MTSRTRFRAKKRWIIWLYTVRMYIEYVIMHEIMCKHYIIEYMIHMIPIYNTLWKT